jgi:hypothetical protein
MLLCAISSKVTALVGWTRALLRCSLWRLWFLSSETVLPFASKTWSTEYFRILRPARQRLLPPKPSGLGQASGGVEAILVPTDDVRHLGLRLSNSSA